MISREISEDFSDEVISREIYEDFSDEVINGGSWHIARAASTS